MAFSKAGKGHREKKKCCGDMSSDPSSSLCSIVEFGLSDQGQDQIMDRSHDLACVSNSHANRIFFQGEIAAVMQNSFDAPVSSSDLQHMGRRSFGTGEAGNAKFHSAGGVVAVSIAPPLKLAFQAIDLCQCQHRGEMSTNHRFKKSTFERQLCQVRFIKLPGAPPFLPW